MTRPPVVSSEDGTTRCSWGDSPPEYRRYHDSEWGFPVADDVRLFEKLCLEGFQSGLSWLTILRKREAFRAAFAGFDFEAVARFGEADVARLLADAGIVRHGGKIEATINNARRAVELVAAEGSLASFLWRFEPVSDSGDSGLPAPDGPAPHGVAGTAEWAPRALSPESEALAKELKRRGWRFVGATTVYSLMQAMGMVNDHHPQCVAHAAVERARADFVRPGGRSGTRA